MKRVIAVLVVLLVMTPATQAEVLEDIVAWVNGEIITKSEFDEEEQNLVADAYRRFTGDELDQKVTAVRQGLLLQMIDRKILVAYARGMGFDLGNMGESLFESFKEQQPVQDDAEIARMLEREGLTIEGVKSRLIEMYAPDEVIRYEVVNRLAVGDNELESFYATNPEMFQLDAEVTIREIVLLADTDAKREERRGDADRLRERAAAGEDFAELAMEFSEAGTRAEGGQLGPLKEGDLSKKLEALAFSMPQGEISPVLETQYGFHFITVEDRKETRVQAYDEIRDNLRGFLEEQRYMEELQAFMKKARSQAQWCVKPRYKEMLSIPDPPACERL